MELRHLRYFVAVAEALHFRKAAERLHITPPTLSLQIKDLEDRINVRLLERDNKRVRLTVAGEVFLSEARALLAQARRSVFVAQEAASGRRGVLKIGNAGPLSYQFIPACLNVYRERFPEVDVMLMEIDVDRHRQALESGEIHIGFATTLDPLALSECNHTQVFDTPLKLIAAKAHPLARQRRISLMDLANVRLLAFGYPNSSSPHADKMLSILRERGIKPGPVKIVSGYESLLAMLAGGQGVTFTPIMRGSGALREGLVSLSFKERAPDLKFQLHAIWKTDEASPLVKNFIDVIKNNSTDQP